MALGAVGVTTLVLFFAQDWISRGPIDMLYLVPVIASASFFGFRSGLVAAIAAGIAYNFFFLPPFYTFIIYGPANLITAILLVIVAIITGQLAAQARAAAALAMRSARENAALARFATRLGAASDTSETAQIVCDEIRSILVVQTMILHGSGDGVKITASGQTRPELSPVDRAAAEWAFEHGEAAGRGTNTLTASDWQFRPLKTSLGTLAVLGLRSPSGRDAVPTERAALAESLIDQAALAHERLKLETDMREMEVVRQRDSLRAALLASLSHDLRTPLTAVTAAAEALSASGEEAELVETVRSEARRLNRFLSDLLDLTRIEEGAVTPDLQPIDLTDAITSAIADLAGPLEGRKLQTSIDPNLPLVRADAVLLHHAILNLIDNAVKYSPEEEPIEVVARMGRRGPVIDVLDRGPGIPQGSEQRIFDRFARGETSDRTGGSGLGLAIVKGFAAGDGVHRRGGAPAAGRLAVHDPDAARGDRPGLDGGHCMSEHILIVDDEMPIRRLLRVSTERSGYVTEEAATAAAALAALRSVEAAARAPGSRPARPGRSRTHRPVPRQGRADHRAHRPRGIEREGRGARSRRGRLRHQAVRQRGAAGAHPLLPAQGRPERGRHAAGQGRSGRDRPRRAQRVASPAPT